MGRKPPVQGDSAVRRQTVYINQRAVFALEALTNVDHRLVLLAFTFLIKIVISRGTWRLHPANSEQLLNARAQLFASGHNMEDLFSVGVLLLDKLLCLRRPGVFQPAVGIGNFVSV